MFSNLYNKCIDYFTYKPKYPLFPDTETLKYYISVVGIIPPYFIFNNLLSSNEDYFPLLYSFSTIGNLEYNTSNSIIPIRLNPNITQEFIISFPFLLYFNDSSIYSKIGISILIPYTYWLIKNNIIPNVKYLHEFLTNNEPKEQFFIPDDDEWE